MAGMDKTPDELKKKTIALAPLLEILECPVCLETVKVPFKQCRMGHLVCSVCAKSLQNCPSCKGAFSSDSQVCMKNLIETLPHVCRYMGNGCMKIVEPNDEHEVYCGYRSVKCLGCDKEQQVFQLNEHFKNYHPENHFHNQTISQIHLIDYTDENGDYSLLIFAIGTLFWLNITKSGSNYLHLSFHAIVIKKPSDEYLITLKFEKDCIGTRVTLKASEDPYKLGEKEGSSIKILQSMVKGCIDNEGKLVFKYELTARPKST